MLCRSELPSRIDLRQHDVEYVFCDECRHLNGTHQDTAAFGAAMYTSDDGAKYASIYRDENYQRRVEDIYSPKVDFLISSLGGIPRILDVGCGSGHFVSAAIAKGAIASGIDIGKDAVDYGNYQIEQLASVRPLQTCSEEGYISAIDNSDAEVVSAIGVIEHLREPHKFFDAFKSSNVQFIYYSVPMFSMSVLIENVFSQIFPRHLSADHNHLFTESSIARMHAILGVASVAEWRFGTDVMDLYRSIGVSLRAEGASNVTLELFEDGFGRSIDEIQGVFDRGHFCSEIHVLARK